MKVLTIGDQHFQPTNIEDIEKFIYELENHLEKNKYDIIVSMGDLLDKHGTVNVLTLNRAVDYLKMLKKYAKTYVLVGNHDMINANQFLTSNHWLYPLKGIDDNLIIVDTVINNVYGNLNFTFCPFVPNGRFIEALYTIDDWKNSTCIFAHQTIDGAKYNGIVVDDSDEWKPDFPLCVSGHIHGPQEVAKNFIYVGSAFHLDSSTSTKRMLSIEWNEKERLKREIKDIHLNILVHKVINTTLSEVESYEYVNKNEKIRFRVECTENDFKTFKKSNKYKELIKMGIKIDPVINRDNNLEFDNNDKKTFLEILEDDLQDDELYVLYREIVYGDYKDAIVELDE